MTTPKLRRLNPQPDDLTTHKGPFVYRGEFPARLVLTDLLDALGRSYVWAVINKPDNERVVLTDAGGVWGAERLIFAAEEIPEPRVAWVIFAADGKRCGSYDTEEAARNVARYIGGTYAEFREVLP